MKFVVLLLVVCGCAARSARMKRHHRPPPTRYDDSYDVFNGGASSGGFDSPFGDYEDRFAPPQVKDFWLNGPQPLSHPPLSNYEDPRNHYQMEHHWSNPHFKHVPNHVAMSHPHMQKVPVNPHVDTTKHHSGPPPNHGIHPKKL
ncbi:hypothetical protein Aduo_019332 [Ancylostoma duodenale]